MGAAATAGGLIGATCDTGTGAELMMAAINEAWLVPSKACRPVIIS